MLANLVDPLAFDNSLYICFLYGNQFLGLSGHPTPCLLYVNSHESFQETAQNLKYDIAPASGVVTYQKVTYDAELNGTSPFRGEPRPELDQAWRDLIKHANIRISEDELQRINRKTIELHDGSGYLGQLGVYHHLHCLVCAP